MPLQTSPWKSLSFVVAALGALVAMTPRVAYAQTVTQTTGATVLDYFPNGTPSSHPNNVDATWISYTDCENNINLNVPLSVSPPANGFAYYSLQAYATTITGTDCSQPTSHSGATGVCWYVGPSSIPVQQNNYVIRVQDLLRNIGAAAGAGLAYTPGTEAACHVAQQSGAIPLQLQFVIADHGGNVASEVTIGLNVELIGPAPPTGITLGIGQNLLILNWTPVNDPNTQGFNIFIDPLPGQEGNPMGTEASTPVAEGGPETVLVCPDAGFTDGGLDDSGDVIEIPVPVDAASCYTKTVYEASAVQSGVCPSSVLQSGVTGTIDSGVTTPVPTTVDSGLTTTTTTDAAVVAQVTGTAPSALALTHVYQQVGGGTQTSATIKGLVDGVNYTVAIAAIDNLNDNGPLSDPKCAIPSPIDDFFEQYRADGGLAGGSFCALEGVGVPTGMGVFGFAMGIATIVSFRRRRRRP